MRLPSASERSVSIDRRMHVGPSGTFGHPAASLVALLGAAVVGSAIGALLWLGAGEAVAHAADAQTRSAILLPAALAGAASAAWPWLVRRRMAAPRRRLGEPGLGGPRFRPDLDILTGLLDRRTFLIFAQDALLYFGRYHRGVALLIVEVDLFQSIVDQHGTAAGDHVLSHVADVLDLSLRRTDKISRFTDQEFAILLREISEADTIALANRMRRAVEDLGMRHGDRIIPVTISIGATLMTERDTDIETLLGRAGKALLAARQGGRNCVNVRSGSPGPGLDQAAREAQAA